MRAKSRQVVHSVSTLHSRFEDIVHSIEQAVKNAHRDPRDVKLLAVSKSRTVEEICQVASCGQVDFGESYVSEAVDKIRQLESKSLTWHYIGHIQSNKTLAIAQHFDWVQSVDRPKVAQRLNNARERTRPNEPLNICIQVNVDDEPQKSGVRSEHVANLANSIRHMPYLKLRGLMAIPKVHQNLDETRTAFRTLCDCFDELKRSFSRDWDTLSMGMSADYELAIEEGSTLVRIGTAIFGPRT